MNRPKHYLVFDVESVGLHGEGFAVAGGVYNPDFDCIYEFAFHCPIDAAKGTDEDRKWVKENVKISESSLEFPKPEDIRDQFWSEWVCLKIKHPDLVMAVECGWPVEGHFLNSCVSDKADSRNWHGPYPLHEIASIMLMANMDPMATYVRRPNELPAHEPLADSRLSARLLNEAMIRIDF